MHNRLQSVPVRAVKNGAVQISKLKKRQKIIRVLFKFITLPWHFQFWQTMGCVAFPEIGR